VDAVEAAGGQLPAAGACGDEDALGGNRRAVVEGDGATGSVKGCGPAAEQPVGAQISERLVVAQGDAVLLPLPGEKLFGQGWAVVGLVGLIADDGDGPVVPVSPQGLRCSGSCQRRSDDC